MAGKKVTKKKGAKKFKVIEVKPEELAAGRTRERVAESSWGGGDVWPGSSSAAGGGREGQSAWGGGDVWPGSASAAGDNRETGREGRSAWGGSDVWPGSASVIQDGADLVITTSTTIRISPGQRRHTASSSADAWAGGGAPAGGDPSRERTGRSAWGGGDVWPGSASAAEGPREGQSAWGGGDVWPGSSAPTGGKPGGERAARSGWQISDRWPGSATPTDDFDEPPTPGPETKK